MKLASAVSFSLFVKHASLSPERLFHVYDIAGEVFTNNDENEVQQQLSLIHIFFRKREKIYQNRKELDSLRLG